MIVSALKSGLVKELNALQQRIHEQQISINNYIDQNLSRFFGTDCTGLYEAYCVFDKPLFVGKIPNIDKLVESKILTQQYQWYSERDSRLHDLTIGTQQALLQSSDDAEDEEKRPFDPIYGIELSKDEVEENLVPAFYPAEKLVEAIKKEEQELIEIGYVNES